MSLISTLTELGLQKREVLVYTALLSLGQATVLQIAEESGLKRPGVYPILEQLLQKGLVLKVPHAKKQIFIAKEPKVFVEDIIAKAEKARGILPELQAITHQKTSPRIFYYEGPQGVSDALVFLSQQRRGDELLGFHTYSPEKEIPMSFKRTALKAHVELGRRGVRYRSILPDHPSARFFDELKEKYGFDWEGKYIPVEEYSSLASFEVYGDLVLLVTRQQEQSIVIENKDIADKHRQIFELLWKCIP